MERLTEKLVDQIGMRVAVFFLFAVPLMVGVAPVASDFIVGGILGFETPQSQIKYQDLAYGSANRIVELLPRRDRMSYQKMLTEWGPEKTLKWMKEDCFEDAGIRELAKETLQDLADFEASYDLLGSINKNIEEYEKQKGLEEVEFFASISRQNSEDEKRENALMYHEAFEKINITAELNHSS